jgi:hypothetical protein
MDRHAGARIRRWCGPAIAIRGSETLLRAVQGLRGIVGEDPMEGRWVPGEEPEQGLEGEKTLLWVFLI